MAVSVNVPPPDTLGKWAEWFGERWRKIKSSISERSRGAKCRQMVKQHLNELGPFIHEFKILAMKTPNIYNLQRDYLGEFIGQNERELIAERCRHMEEGIARIRENYDRRIAGNFSFGTLVNDFNELVETYAKDVKGFLVLLSTHAQTEGVTIKVGKGNWSSRHLEEAIELEYDYLRTNFNLFLRDYVQFAEKTTNTDGNIRTPYLPNLFAPKLYLVREYLPKRTH